MPMRFAAWEPDEVDPGVRTECLLVCYMPLAEAQKKLRETLNANKLSSFERRSESWTPPTRSACAS